MHGPLDMSGVDFFQRAERSACRPVGSYETACQPLLVGLWLSGLCCVRCGWCGGASRRGWLASWRAAAGLQGPARGSRRGPGRVGAACRGVVVAVATARLIFACRDRRSAVRRTLPFTTRGIRLAHSCAGVISCRGVVSRHAAGLVAGLAVSWSSRPRRSPRARGRRRRPRRRGACRGRPSSARWRAAAAAPSRTGPGSPGRRRPGGGGAGRRPRAGAGRTTPTRPARSGSPPGRPW